MDAQLRIMPGRRAAGSGRKPGSSTRAADHRPQTIRSSVMLKSRQGGRQRRLNHSRKAAHLIFFGASAAPGRHQEAPLQAPAYRPLSPLIAVDANAKVIGSATCKCVCISVVSLCVCAHIRVRVCVCGCGCVVIEVSVCVCVCMCMCICVYASGFV